MSSESHNPTSFTDPEPDPETVMLRHERRRRVEAVLSAHLDDGEVAVIVALYFANFSVEQASDELAITPRQVTIRRATALSKLRDVPGFADLLRGKA